MKNWCNHQLLDWDPAIQRYRCRDCPNHFEARIVGTYMPDDSEKPVKQDEEPVERKEKVWPTVAAFLGLLVLTALVAVGLFFWKSDKGGDCQPKIVEKVVKIPTECPACPQETVKECPLVPECPVSEPDDDLPAKECPKEYKNEFQQCMNERGTALYELEQCEERERKAKCEQQANEQPPRSCDADLRRANRKIEELRGWVSRLTRTQGGKCPDVRISGSQRGCEKEIEAACGNLREALRFYFNKADKQPGAEDGEGMALPLELLKPGAIFDSDEETIVEEDIEWDED